MICTRGSGSINEPTVALVPVLVPAPVFVLMVSLAQVPGLDASVWLLLLPDPSPILRLDAGAWRVGARVHVCPGLANFPFPLAFCRARAETDRGPESERDCVRELVLTIPGRFRVDVDVDIDIDADVSVDPAAPAVMPESPPP